MFSILIMLLAIVRPPLPFEGKLTPELKCQLAQAGPTEKIFVIVHMQKTYPYDDVKGLSIKEKARLFRDIAERNQRPLINYLKQFPDKAEIIQQFWVFNGFHLKATKDVIESLSKRDDILFICHNGIIRLPPIKKSKGPSTKAIEWNVNKVKAPDCWNDGFTGKDVIIGHIDTGCDWNHPALQGNWSGYWKDCVNNQSNPYDDNGHGTHTTGTICGGDGNGSFTNDIGVAPDAKIVTAKSFDAGGSATYADIDEAYQWITDLKSNQSVDIRAVSNSWGGGGGDTHFWDETATWVSLDIFPVFANGNEGPGSSTANSPGDYPLVIGVGATDNSDQIANFSSRGPAPNQSPWNVPSNWYRSDWNRTKPDISAPGVNIRSSVPGGGYEGGWDGTSMATPHVAGAVAILCEKNPTLTPEQLYNILLDNSDPTPGGGNPNNNYGWGRLNIYAALQATPTTDQPWMKVLSYEITDPPPGGNGNGQVEPGETVQMVVTLKNIGGKPGYNTTGRLRSHDNYVTLQNSLYNYGDLDTNQTADNSDIPYLIITHDLTPPGHTAKLSLVIHSDGEHDTLDFDDTIYYYIQIGTPPPPTVLWEEDYEYTAGIDSFLEYWDVTGNWNRVDNQSHSPTHSAYSGNIVNGWTYLTLKNWIDLSAINQNIYLDWWQKYNWDDGFWGQYQLQYDKGSGWKLGWEWDWGSDPDQMPWTEFNVDLKKADSLKLRVRLQSNDFFQSYNRWWLDDLKLTTPTDNEPPYFRRTTKWNDTTYTGPFLVQSKITDANGIDSAYLYYRVNSGSWAKTPMSPTGNNWYEAYIPQQQTGDVIDYYLWARDKWPFGANEGCMPIGAPSYGYYSFQIIEVGITEDLRAQIQYAPLMSNPTRDKVAVKFSIPKDFDVSIRIYDITGRRIKTLLNKKISAGVYQLNWDKKDEHNRTVATGIYFLKFDIDEVGYNRINKIILIK